jgi:hypothetical protein
VSGADGWTSIEETTRIKITSRNNNKQLFFLRPSHNNILHPIHCILLYYIIAGQVYYYYAIVGGMYIMRIILSRVFMDDSKTLNRHNTGPSALLIKYVRPKTSEASAFVESLMPSNLCTLPAPREIVNFLLPIVRPGPSPYHSGI